MMKAAVDSQKKDDELSQKRASIWYKLRTIITSPKTILPPPGSSIFNPLNWLRYLAAGFVTLFIYPIAWLAGLRADAANAEGTVAHNPQSTDMSASGPYEFNPHTHVKIWISSKPNVFMNDENQARLIAMRVKNPKDKIHLVYDSTVLNDDARRDLDKFCTENDIIAVDAAQMQDKLKSDRERALYDHFKNEIHNLNTGGNLGVASDILRWISPVYNLGAYTDFDFPINTSNLPDKVKVNAPLLLNIGSLKLVNNDFIITNNDFVAVVDEAAAKSQIERVQDGIISKLTKYGSDVVDRVMARLGGKSFFTQQIVGMMKNRAEYDYLLRSNDLAIKRQCSSLELRAFVKETMSDPTKFLNFIKHHPEETKEAIIARLRSEFQKQLGFLKWLFFRQEYRDIKAILALSDDKFIDAVMKRERSLYIKAIVVCTTGPLEIARSLFNDYVIKTAAFDQQARPFSFKNYGLESAFQSQNNIHMHESIFGTLRYLGTAAGKVSDSSWLEEGQRLQALRERVRASERNEFQQNLPHALNDTKERIEARINAIQQSLEGFFGSFRKDRKEAKIAALKAILDCFEQDSFDIAAFNQALENHSGQEVFAGLFFHHTQQLIEELGELCFNALTYRLVAEDHKLSLKPRLPDFVAPAPVKPVTTQSQTTPARTWGQVNDAVSGKATTSAGFLAARSVEQTAPVEPMEPQRNITVAA